MVMNRKNRGARRVRSEHVALCVLCVVCTYVTLSAQATPSLQFRGAPPLSKHATITTATDSANPGPGGKVALFVDMTPNPGVHVYAPGAKDYLPVKVTLKPQTDAKAGKLTSPEIRDALLRAAERDGAGLSEGVPPGAGCDAREVGETGIDGDARRHTGISSVRRQGVFHPRVSAGELDGDGEVAIIVVLGDRSIVLADGSFVLVEEVARSDGTIIVRGRADAFGPNNRKSS